MKCLILMVNYGDSSPTINFLKSLEKQVSNSKIVVLDNYNPLEIGVFEETIFLTNDIEIIRYDKNLGYFGAAIEYLRKLTTIPEWIIIANNDLILEKGNIGEVLSKYSNSHELGVLAPSIIDKETNRELNPHFYKELSFNKKLIYKFYYLHYFCARIIQFIKTIIYNKKIEAAEYGQYIYSPNGAIFILKKTIIKELLRQGNISFLYGEEILITECCKLTDKKVYFTDELKFIHSHSISTGKNFSKNKFKRMKEAYVNSKIKNYSFYKL